jgi:hypothetical protein
VNVRQLGARPWALPPRGPWRRRGHGFDGADAAFENADEFNHCNRADPLASGTMIATRPGGPSTSIDTVCFDGESRVTRDMMAAAGTVAWGPRRLLVFDNTAIYPPLSYIRPATVVHPCGLPTTLAPFAPV